MNTKAVKTVAELTHEKLRELQTVEIEAKERARIYRAKMGQIRTELKGLMAEDAGQQVNEEWFGR